MFINPSTLAATANPMMQERIQYWTSLGPTSPASETIKNILIQEGVASEPCDLLVVLVFLSLPAAVYKCCVEIGITDPAVTDLIVATLMKSRPAYTSLALIVPKFERIAESLDTQIAVLELLLQAATLH